MYIFLVCVCVCFIPATHKVEVYIDFLWTENVFNPKKEMWQTSQTTYILSQYQQTSQYSRACLSFSLSVDFNTYFSETIRVRDTKFIVTLCFYFTQIKFTLDSNQGPSRSLITSLSRVILMQNSSFLKIIIKRATTSVKIWFRSDNRDRSF